MPQIMRSSNNEVHIHRPYCGLGRPKISRPLFATLQRSKASPSSSRSNSTSSSPASTPPIDPLTSAKLRSLATTLLTALAPTHDLRLASTLIAPDAQIQHEDHPTHTSRSSFLGAWQGMLTRAPDFHIELIEAVADERERKVWMKGLITVCGKLKDGTMVMIFDEEGMCVRIWTQGRLMRKDKGEEEE
jgi:hypothetical protein